MRLDCVVVACNENPRYTSFWPIVKKAWWDIAKLPCVMVYVAESLPEELAKDPAVRHVKPIPGWPTATQAQCIRLLYPALLKCEGAVMVSDMDMIPMQRAWFVDGFAGFSPDQFVSLRGIDEEHKQIYMCYVGATPQVWATMFSVTSDESMYVRMKEWSTQYPADGRRGGVGWCTDQMILYRRVKECLEESPQMIGLQPWTQEISRLDRCRLSELMIWLPEVQQAIRTTSYVDFHMPPWDPFAPMIQDILMIRTLG